MGRSTAFTLVSVGAVIALIGFILPWVDYGGFGRPNGWDFMTHGEVQGITLPVVLGGIGAVVALVAAFVGIGSRDFDPRWSAGLAAAGGLAVLAVAVGFLYDMNRTLLGDAAMKVIALGVWVTGAGGLVTLIGGIAAWIASSTAAPAATSVAPASTLPARPAPVTTVAPQDPAPRPQAAAPSLVLHVERAAPELVAALAGMAWRPGTHGNPWRAWRVIASSVGLAPGSEVVARADGTNVLFLAGDREAWRIPVLSRMNFVSDADRDRLVVADLAGVPLLLLTAA